MLNATATSFDPEGLEVRSECAASSSRRSNKSSSSIAAAQARAKAEGARRRAAFAKRQIDMQIEKARIEATLNALKEECEAEAASAEADVFEAFVKAEKSESEKGESHASLIHQSIERTGEYVRQHFLCSIDENHPQPAGVYSPNYYSHRHKDSVSQTPVTAKANATNVSELAVYLSRRDFITAGLNVFDDQPASYLSWKSSFNNAVEGLNLKPSEELDLIIKWLGGESLQHAKRIRAVYVNNPAEGLDMVWQRLDRSYGSPEAIEAFLFSRLHNFPKISIKDSKKLQELSDLLLEILGAKKEDFLPGLNFLDTARGINPILEKLPHSIQEQWMSKGSHYKREHCVPYPPFSFFVDFVCQQAEMRNDPSFFLSTSSIVPFRVEKQHSIKSWKPRASFSVNRTEVENFGKSSSEYLKEDPDKQCPLHKRPHSLKKCRAFRSKTLVERKRFLSQHFICFRCCASTVHQAKDCRAVVHCEECNSDRHISALRAGPAPWLIADSSTPMEEHGGEQSECASAATTSMCTEVCGGGLNGKSCSKICLVNVYPKGHPEKKVRMYVLLDDQSNVSLARSAFFDTFKIQGDACPYTLKTCSGMTDFAGRRANGFIVESIDGDVCLSLPTLTECDLIPNNRDEIPTPQAARNHIHLKAVADKIPPLDHNAEIFLLLGRDIICVHKVRDQCNGHHNEPFAQRLDLGWVLIGNVCLNGVHRPTVCSYKTNILWNGRPSYLTPCENNIYMKVQLSGEQNKSPVRQTCNDVGKSVFRQSENDYKLAVSFEDELFLEIMNQEFCKDDTSSWVAPLPFRKPRQRLPNNRQHALNRLMSLSRTLKKNTEKKDHFIDFMEKIFENNHAEVAPPIDRDKECWYLPSFGVYHPKKPGQIRIVFDSSARFNGVSLNDVLLRGPDLNNSLLGVLMRFRTEPVAVMTDIKQMFHSFLVKEDHRDYLRFLWFRNHQLEGEIVDYRMRVHVFGNCPSPAVAIYGLKKTALEGESEYGTEVRKFIERHFYVDDGLKSFPVVDEAVSLLKAAQEMLAKSNLKLHKIASNELEVMKAFPAVDLAKGLQDLDVGQDLHFEQRSLGLKWDLVADTLTFQVVDEKKTYTRRGVLSAVNSLFDPLGFAAPVSVQGRKILRDLTSDVCDWDAPLPEHKFEEWRKWCTSLQDLKEVKIPRMYTSIPHSQAQEREVCIFCDASTKAIAAVAYLKVANAQGQTEVGFIFGKTKLAPNPDLTIPRLELCAAVLAVEMAEVISEELDLALKNMKFFTDSKVVLGYIFNESRRFFVYVNNRVQRIRRSTQKHQWHYVQTDLNPADCGTRTVSANQLLNSAWLSGPKFLLHTKICQPVVEVFALLRPESDAELRPEVTTCITNLSPRLGSARFERFSSWASVSSQEKSNRVPATVGIYARNL